MEQQFKIEIKNGNISDTVHFHGNIDSHSDDHMEGLIKRIYKKNVVLDFSGTGRINSMGVALLLRSIKSLKAEKNAEVSIQGANKINTMLFKMTGIYLLAPEAKRL
ncbi:MAG: STAS domain-containing protein [Oryzomonas sp.]